jgi:hypothetical protein
VRIPKAVQKYFSAKEIASVQRMVSVIERDSRITGELLDKNGNTCAVGGLMVAAGIKPRVGQEEPTSAQDLQLVKAYPVLARAELMLGAIMDANDDNTNRRDRVVAVKDAIVDILNEEVAFSEDEEEDEQLVKSAKKSVKLAKR